MPGWMVSRLLVLFLCFSEIHADLTISTSTPTPCYGDVVTLVCHHPEVASNPGRYLTTGPVWREDRVGIRPSTGIYLQSDTSEDLTHTTLTINITVDHFRNKSFHYSCLLLLAENGLPTGEVETSGDVTVDPVDLTPPKVTNIDPFESFITVEWTPQPCAVRYRVSWMYTNDDGTTTTGSGVPDQVTNYTIPTSVQGVYTVSVQAVDGMGNVGPATGEVVRSTYPRPTADAPPCKDRSLVLTCLVSGLHNDRRSLFMWIDRNSNLTNSSLYTITGPQLMIANVSAVSDEKDKAIRCCEVLSNRIIVEGVEYKVEPLAQPGPPEVTITTTTDSTITLTWNTALRCFESEMLTFVVIWNEIGSGTSTNVTTSSSPYTISGLQPVTSYQISVQGVGGSGVVGGIRVLNAATPESPLTEGVNLAAAIAGTVVGVVTILTVVMVISSMLWIHWRKGKQGQYATRTVPEPHIQPYAQTSGDQTRTGYYAQVGFEDQPVPAPPVEVVAYANPIAVGEEEVKDTVPVLPTKQQDHHRIEEFRSDVVHALIAVGAAVTAIETGGVPHFTAEYNDIHFVVTCVYTSSDLNSNHVDSIVEAKQVTGSTKGLLISNQSTIPSECLLTLEDAGCQFVPVGGYGEEGWEDRMIDKFKDVFPEVADDDSESEDLPTSEQETTPLSDTRSPVIQPRTVVTRLLSPVGFTIKKRRNAPGGDWEESEEETTPSRDFRSVSLHRDSESLPSPVQISNLSSSDYQFPQPVLSRAADDDVKTHDDQFRSPDGCTTTIVGGQYSVYMPPISGVFMSFLECKLSDEDKVFHKVPQEEAMPVPVQETPLTTCPPPSTAASIANLQYPEEPLHTAASVASEKSPEMLPMALTDSSHEYREVVKVDDSSINPEQTPVSFEHTDVSDMESLPNLKMKEIHFISDISPWRRLMSLHQTKVCKLTRCFEPFSRSWLIPVEENKDSIIPESTDLPPVNKPPTQFSGKTYGSLGGLKTPQNPSQPEQNWGLWTSKKTDLFLYTSTVKDGVHNISRKLWYTLVHWSAHLFQTALHHSGALFVLRPEL